MSKEDFIIEEVLRYVQVPSEQADEALKKQIVDYYAKLQEIAQPRWLYRPFTLTKDESAVRINGTTITLESQDLLRLFRHSQTCYILAATLGLQVDRFINEAQMRHMGEALFLNACANVMIEEVCDMAEQEIMKELSEKQYMTMRYSPGYGDVPLEVQKDIVKILGTQKNIGLTLSKSDILLPLKSITAFIGISTERENREKSCKACMMQSNCIYRKRGDVCGH